jgi:hypothetical protein
MDNNDQLASVDVLLPFNTIDEYLNVAIKSVLANRDVHVNLLLIDDQPPTRYRDIKFYHPQVEIIRTHGIGYYSALNVASAHLKSDYVTLMNSDDIVSCTKYTEQIKALIADESDFCVTYLSKFKGKFSLFSKFGKNSSKKFTNEYLLLGSYFADATWLTKRSFWEREVVFGNEKIGDWALALQVFPNNKVSIVPKVHYWYRKHENQMTAEINFHKSSATQIYPLWKDLAKRYRWPDLNLNSFGLIAAPLTLQSNLSRSDIYESINWLLKLTKNKDKIISKLARRRYLYICIKYFPYRDFRKFKVFTFIKAFLEFLQEILYSKKLLPKYIRTY